MDQKNVLFESNEIKAIQQGTFLYIKTNLGKTITLGFDDTHPSITIFNRNYMTDLTKLSDKVSENVNQLSWEKDKPFKF